MDDIRDPLTTDENCYAQEKTADSSADPDEYGTKRRSMHFKEEVWFYWVRVGFLIVSAFGSFSVVLVYMWHLIGPSSCRWLCENELTKLKELALTIIVGLLMSVTTTYFFKKNGNR